MHNEFALCETEKKIVWINLGRRKWFAVRCIGVALAAKGCQQRQFDGGNYKVIKEKNEFNSQQVVSPEPSCDGGSVAASDRIQYKAMLIHYSFRPSIDAVQSLAASSFTKAKVKKKNETKTRNELKIHILSVIRIIILSIFSPLQTTYTV